MIDDEYHLVVDEDSVDSYIHELELNEVSIEPEPVLSSFLDQQTSLASIVLVTMLVGGITIGMMLHFRKKRRREGADAKLVAIRAEMEGCSNLRQVQGVLSDYFSDLSMLEGNDMGLSLLMCARDMLTKALDAGEGEEATMDSDESCKATIHDAHALLQKVEGILASVIDSLPREYATFRLHHRDKEVVLVQLISSLNVQLEPLREKVDGKMFSTLPFKSSEYAQELKKDIKRGQEASASYTTLMGPALVMGDELTLEVAKVEDREISVVRLEMELAARKLAESMAYVRVYDKSHKYTGVLSTATTVLEELEQLDRCCEDKLLSRRTTDEQRTSQEMLGQTQQALLAAVEDNPDPRSRALKNADSAVVSLSGSPTDEFNSSVTHMHQSLSSPLSKDAATMIYSKYLLDTQSRIKNLREDSRKQQEGRDQRRMDHVLASAQQAEQRYRNDTENEVDKKMKLAGLNLQRSTLKIADRDWAEKRARTITASYMTAIASRKHRDLVLWGVLLLLTSLAFSIAASGCTFRNKAASALSELCYLLSQESCVAAPGDGSAPPGLRSLPPPGAEHSNQGALEFLHRSSTAFYDSLLAPMSWAASKLLATLGLDIKELLLALFPTDTLACCMRVCLRLVVPYLGYRVASLTGAGGQGRAPLVFLVGAYLSLLDPIHAILSFMDRFVAFLAAHTLIFICLAIFDPSLQWSCVCWAEGRRAPSKVIDYRVWLLYFIYPLAAVVLSLVLGCVSSSLSFSRGVRVGRRLDLWGVLTECVPASLTSCGA